MAKRLTAEQKQAIKKYWNTVASCDNYLASVFVSAEQTAYYKRLLEERAIACETLGVPQITVDHHDFADFGRAGDFRGQF